MKLCSWGIFSDRQLDKKSPWSYDVMTTVVGCYLCDLSGPVGNFIAEIDLAKMFDFVVSP